MDKNFLNDFPILRSKMNGHPLTYLDNSATTQKPESVVRSICGYYGGCNANPHRGVYELSVKATKVYEDARRKVAAFLNAKPQEIIFTKNATESLNLIAYSFGLNNLHAGDEILITIAEHHSNLVPWQRVARATGATLNYIYLAADGNLSAEEIDKKLTRRTKILAVTQISNVLGLVNDVKTLAARAHEVGAVVVVDGAQSVPHIPVDVKLLRIDILSASAHKFNGPKGIGFLYVRDGLKLLPHIDGGGQEFSRRAGTENVPAIAAMALALEKNLLNMERNTVRVKTCADELLTYLRANEIDFILNGGENRLPGHLSLSFKNCDGESLMHRLDLKNICVATGSACNSQQTKISHVLQALKIPQDYIRGTIRITFGKENSHDDAKTIGNNLVKILQPCQNQQFLIR